jgi:hypothetical protein
VTFVQGNLPNLAFFREGDQSGNLKGIGHGALDAELPLRWS